MKNALFVFIIFFTIFFSACGRKNPLSLNSQPEIRITSSYGVEDIQFSTDDTISFQQTIYWNTIDQTDTFRSENQIQYCGWIGYFYQL